MPKYLCVMRTGTGECESSSSPPSPEKMQEMYARFNAWKGKFSDNIVDLGGKLSGSSAVLTSEGATDGPFMEVKEIVGGFMIIEADNMDQAIEVVNESPGAPTPNTSVEIREIQVP